MSKVKIQGNASGTGVLTVTAPNTSTDRTITLPDTTGTLLDENSSVPAANLTGTVADARISALTASKLTGALPAISGASLTGLKAGSGAFSARSTNSWTAINSGVIVGFNDDSSGDNFDTDGVYNTSSYKYVAPAAGVYMFWYAVYTAEADTDNAFGYLKNSATLNFQSDGDNFFSRWNGSANDHLQTATIVVPLASGDTMAVCATREGDYYGGHSQWGGCRLA